MGSYKKPPARDVRLILNPCFFFKFCLGIIDQYSLTLQPILLDCDSSNQFSYDVQPILF